jgi:hypothetical protein
VGYEKNVKILGGNPEGKKSLRTLRSIWEYKIKMDISKMEMEGLDWTHMA